MKEIIDQLNAWLEEPGYDAGVELYQQHVGSGFLLRMLKTGADDYNRERLRQALETKRDELTEAYQAQLASYPQPLHDALEEAKLLMDERTILKERMRTLYAGGVTQGEQLEAWAFRILTITETLDAIYGRRHFFDKHGYLPEVAQVDSEQTPADRMKRLHTVRTYVSKYQKQLAEATSEKDRRNFHEKLKRYQSELNDLNQQLTAPDSLANPHVILD